MIHFISLLDIVLKRNVFKGGLSLLVLMVVGIWPAYGEFPALRLEAVSMNEIASPVGMSVANDGTNRLYVVGQRGVVNVIDGGVVQGTPFMDISSLLVSERPGFDERGLLSVAFHPEYGQVGSNNSDKLYAYYSAPSALSQDGQGNPINHVSHVSEFRLSGTNPNQVDIGSERVLMEINQPQFNHNAGQIRFGPDGHLYISTGDGGSSNDNNAGHTGGNSSQPNGPTVLGNAQDRTNLLGNVLRIDVNGSNSANGQYGIPNDNPFVGEGNGVREEIYAYGLRNPWRFSFDDGTSENPGTGELYLADVGQGKVEEVNIITKGANMGWRIKEGTLDFDPTVNNPNPGDLVDPIVEYTRASLAGDPDVEGLLQVGVAAVTGHVYRGSEIAGLEGKFIMADWSEGFVPGAGTLLGIEMSGPEQFDLVRLDIEGGNPIEMYINAIGEDENGELYILGRTVLAADGLDGEDNPTGVIFKLVAVPEPSMGLIGVALMGVFVRRKRSV